MSAFGELAGLLHDTGKYLPLFQHYIKSSAGLIPPESPCYTDPVKYKGRIDHSTAGGLYIWKYGESCVDRSIAKIIALCVLSHHGGLLNLLNPDGTDTFTVRLENKLDDDTCLQIFSSIEPDILKRIEKLIPMLADQFTAKWSSIRHKNGNNITLYFHAGLLIRFLFSSLIDADRTDTARFEKDENDSGSDEFSWDEQIQKLDRRLSAFSCKNRVDKIRKTVSESCLNFAHRKKGLFQLTVPTGGGKTLASLRFALNHAAHHKMKRIIYIIPYTSIIDQNAAEIRKILEDREELSGRIVLEHHSNITSDNEEELKRTKCLTENWNSPVIFTTMVQFLETLFSHGTRGVRRMHNLADSVMIFDEIQTLPVKTVHMFNNAINFFVEQCGSSAVFCTATQPLLDKVDQELGSAKLSPNHRIMADTESLFSGLKRTEVIDNRKVGGWETE
jgi:CRISPR-associated endonuclease/helicase Cas3